MTSPQKLKIIFMGTPQVAATILDGLIKEGYNFSSVVTRTDKPKGRSGDPAESPVKKLAEKTKISVFQPKNKHELEEYIKVESPDLVIVTAFGMIITKETLNVPKFGSINVHFSLLPAYRGPWPIGAAILNGEKLTGTTIMLMSEGMDEGDILAQATLELAGTETTPSLSESLTKLSIGVILDTIPNYLDGKIAPQKQDDSRATYMKMVRKEDGRLDFRNHTAEEIERMSRAYTPWPGTYAFWDNKKVEFIGVTPLKADVPPGKIEFRDNRLLIGTKKGSFSPLYVKLEGKQQCETAAFLCGHPDFANTTLK